MHPCPHCLSGDTERVRRTYWMRVFSNMIRLYCRDCGKHSAMFVKSTYTKVIDL